jgi:hypothetical protein
VRHVDPRLPFWELKNPALDLLVHFFLFGSSAPRAAMAKRMNAEETAIAALLDRLVASKDPPVVLKNEIREVLSPCACVYDCLLNEESCL